jgi:peptidoglycan/LPS O-acetylase OafA/YrhL
LCIEVVGWALYRHLASVGSGAVTLACFTVTSIAVSAFTFYWLEMPMMRIGRAINMRWRTILPRSTTASD